MTSTRLTQALRKDAVEAATRAVVVPKAKKLAERIQAFVDKQYEKKFGTAHKEIKAIADKYGNHCVNWIQDLKFNIPKVDGEGTRTAELFPYSTGARSRMIGVSTRDLLDHVANSLPYHYRGFKLSSAKAAIGNTITLSTKRDIQAMERFQKEAKMLLIEEAETRDRLTGFFAACKTYKQVEDNAPELLKYLPLVEKPMKLPIPLIDDIRKQIPA